MNDAGFALRVAYQMLLSGLTYNGNPVKVYDLMAANDAAPPYVIIGPWSASRQNTKHSFGQEGEIAIDVVTRGVNLKSSKPASEIAALITGLLKPTPSAEVLEVTGFQCWNTIILEVQDLMQSTATDTIIRKIISVQHSLQQV